MSASGGAGERAAERQAAAGDVAFAWNALLALRRHAERFVGAADSDLCFDGDRIHTDVARAKPVLILRDGELSPAPNMSPSARALIDLYLPVASATALRPVTIAHLGQSLDGYIATDSGDSYYVTGPQNLLHLHRMRALCGAVIVGAETVAMDDPRLTARLADGPNPLRVVLDPRRRLDAGYRVFADDATPTVLISAEDRAAVDAPLHGHAQVLGIPAPAGRLALDILLERLRARGIHAVFVEGGGATVSHFLQADLLDRLQVAVAPLVTGHGRPGIRLLARHHISDCLRPAHRLFRMGADVLFDCDLRDQREQDADPVVGAADDLVRIL